MIQHKKYNGVIDSKEVDRWSDSDPGWRELDSQKKQIMITCEVVKDHNITQGDIDY